MENEENPDAPRMTVDESPVASTSTSSADAVAPDSKLVDEARERQDASTSPQSMSSTGDSTARTSEPVKDAVKPAPESTTSMPAPAPAKSEPEIRVWKPVAPGTMPKPRERNTHCFQTIYIVHTDGW